MNKLRYRRDSNGYYIPQYKTKDGEWIDFKVKNLFGQLKFLAEILAEFEVSKWTPPQYHYTPGKNQQVEDMSIVFKTEMRVMSFLGGARVAYFSEPVEFKE